MLAFRHFSLHLQANWTLPVLIPGWVGLCVFYDPVGLSTELSCEDGSFSWCLSPYNFLQPEVLRLYFPVLECSGNAGMRCMVCLTTQLFFGFIHMEMWDHLVHRHCHAEALSAPPASVEERFLFNSLVVRLPYSLIFWQFWVFFVFKFVVVLLLVVQEGKVYLRPPPCWLEVCFGFLLKLE